MKKNKSLRGATNKNTTSELTSRGMFFEQKNFQSRIQYQAVYEALNELTEKGYNCFQIEQIIKLGEEAYRNGKTL